MQLRPYEPADAAVAAGWAASAAETRMWCGLAEVELARIVVAPGRRGRGVGRVLATALAGRAVAHSPTVVLRVHPSNPDALRCYAGAGFSRVPPAEADEWNQGQPVAYTWLRR